jgi:AmiR/NasT family two-component response regulator
MCHRKAADRDAYGSTSAFSVALVPPSDNVHADDGTSDHRLTAGERRLRLIVVEDDALIAMELAQTIEAAGGELIGTVATADDAAMLAAEMEADVIVIDLHLKGRGDGLSAAEAICKGSSPAVLFITGSAAAATIERIRSFNGSAPLFKPLRYGELPGAILRAVRLHSAT